MLSDSPRVVILDWPGLRCRTNGLGRSLTGPAEAFVSCGSTCRDAAAASCDVLLPSGFGCCLRVEAKRE